MAGCDVVMLYVGNISAIIKLIQIKGVMYVQVFCSKRI